MVIECGVDSVWEKDGQDLMKTLHTDRECGRLLYFSPHLPDPG